MEYKEQGNSFTEKKDYTESIIQFKKAIEIDSNFADCYFNLGLSYFKLGNIMNPLNTIPSRSKIS